MGLLIRFIILTVGVLLWSASHSQRATDAEMARQAMNPLVGTKDPEERSRRLERHLQAVVDYSRASPNLIRSASIVFNTGLSQGELLKFVDRHNLTVLSFNLKAPMNNTGMIYTSLVGLDDLLVVRGSFERRLKHAVELQQKRILDLANAYADAGTTEEDSRRAREYFELAFADHAIYAIEAFGSSKAISSTSTERVVAGVLLDQSDTKIRTYEFMVGQK